LGGHLEQFQVMPKTIIIFASCLLQDPLLNWFQQRQGKVVSEGS